LRSDGPISRSFEIACCTYLQSIIVSVVENVGTETPTLGGKRRQLRHINSLVVRPVVVLDPDDPAGRPIPWPRVYRHNPPLVGDAAPVLERHHAV